MGITFASASSENLYNTSGSPISTAPFSMACWFNTTEMTNGKTLMSIGANGEPNFHHDMLLTGSGPGNTAGVQSFTDTGNDFALTSTSYSSGVWHHVAGVFAATNSRTVQLDAAGKGTDTGTRAVTGKDSVTIGMTSDSSPTNYMDGIIAVPCVWDVALTDDDVLALASGAHPLTVRPANIQAFWELAHVTDLRDPVGDFDLTASGGATAEDPPAVHVPFPLICAAAGAAMGNSQWYYRMLARRRSA